MIGDSRPSAQLLAVLARGTSVSSWNFSRCWPLTSSVTRFLPAGATVLSRAAAEIASVRPGTFSVEQFRLKKLTLDLNMMLLIPISFGICLICQTSLRETFTPAATKSSQLSFTGTCSHRKPSVFPWQLFTHVRNHIFHVKIFFHFIFWHFLKSKGFDWFPSSQLLLCHSGSPG